MASYRKQISTLLCLSLLWMAQSYSIEIITHAHPSKEGVFQPWLTGPLLAPSSLTLPQGHVNLEPYIFSIVNTGVYNSHWHAQSQPNFYSNNLQMSIQVGITPWMDFQFTPQAFYNISQGAKSFEFGDMPIVLDFQLYHSRVGSWIPNVKFSLRANIPFGKYQHLNPSKNGTDGVGAGSWNPTVQLAFGQLFHVSKDHVFSPRLQIVYVVPNPVHVAGDNVYGGGKGTRGRVFPGNSLLIDFAWEYNLTQRWVLALDTVYAHSNKTRFSGRSPAAPVGSPSSENFNIAPAIEYNFSANIGLIGGAWVTLFGRNSAQFVSGVLSLNIYI